MSHDIGEALDLLVGARQIGGPLAHPLLEAGVEGGDLGLGPDELPRIEQHRPDRAAHEEQDRERANWNS